MNKNLASISLTALLVICPVGSQEKLPVVRSTVNVISIQDGDVMRKDSWTLSPGLKPDVYETTVKRGRTKRVVFMTDIDSLGFDVEAGKKYDFIIQKDGVACYTQIDVRELHFWDDADFWQSPALKTPYKQDISPEEKIAGLAKFWSEAKYNFGNFHLVPDLDWDKTYFDFIPLVLATRSTLEYYRVLQMFCACLKDGHTTIQPPDELDDHLYGKPPIATRLVEDRVIIINILDERLKNEGLAIGQEILEIDAVPVKAYAEERVRPYASESTPQAYDSAVYQRSLLNGPVAKPVELTIADLAGRIFKRTLPRWRWQEINKLLPVRPPVEMKILPGNVAHVIVNTMMDNAQADKIFARHYADISKADALVLDLRENSGGSSGVGYRILAFLTDKPVRSSAWFTRDYRPAFRAWARPQERYGQDGPEIPSEQLKHYRGEDTTVYDKPVIVLTSPRTASAAEDFLVAFKPLKRGLIVGEPSNGSTGQPLFISLPGGGSARICSKHDSFPDGTEFVGFGVLPDILAKPKISDFVEGKDTVLDTALQELNKANKTKSIIPRR